VIQELWDTTLFGLDWNTELVGKRPAQEDIASASARVRGKRRERLDNWYPRRVDEARWPVSALLCQRASAVWGRRRHATQGTGLVVATGGWLLATIIIGLAADVSLADYLIRLFLPSTPAIVDATDLARAHCDLSQRKQKIELASDGLLEEERSNGAVDAQDCRRLQDQIFEVRRRTPRVAWSIYSLRRKSDNAAMEDAVDELLRLLAPVEASAIPTWHEAGPNSGAWE
jgi:hypothetical protein